MENKLKIFRATRSLSGSDVAKELGITAPAYYNLEKGETDIKIKHIRKIRDAFNLSLQEIAEIFNI